MSSQPPIPSRSGSVANGPPSATIPSPGNSHLPPTPGVGSAQQQSAQNLNQIVLEYLSKKGYSKTEAALRKESAHVDGNGIPIITKVKDEGGPAYEKAFGLLQGFVDDSLEAYRPELYRLLWPIFVHCKLNLAADFYPRDSERFYDKFHARFEREHADELRKLSKISLPEHLDDGFALLYRTNKYRLTFTKMAFSILFQFLESKEDAGGDVVINMINIHINSVQVDRATAGSERSLAAMLARKGEEWDMPAEDEGIPGHNPGSANTDVKGPTVLPKLALGPLVMDEDLMEDVKAQLEEQDLREPPETGSQTLVSVFDEKIKREPMDDGPSREQVPLPPPLARDVAMEVQKIREHRDRFKIDPISNGTAPGICVCMYTFHNTYDGINCLDFSGDLLMVAAGTRMSTILVWSTDGEPLIGQTSGLVEKQPTSMRRLIGHQGPVYAVSFGPATEKPSEDGPGTSPRVLLSSSADKTIRLWSIDGWCCLCQFRGHNSPVWDVRWGPFGHYFVSCGMDKVVRVWSQEHIQAIRMFAGHDGHVDAASWHPNGSYVFSAGDKTVRMWDIMRGTPVRMFTGHTGNITTIECAPNGKVLASADDQGCIILWDLNSGLLMKRMRGHGKGGIWSLAWSVESTMIVSGGADYTVRSWDIAQRQENKAITNEVGKVDGSMSAPPIPGLPPPKKSRKDVVVTSDQLSVFPAKKSPVYKVMFSRSNLVIAGSAFIPDPA